MCNCPVPCSGADGKVVYRPCGKCLDCLRQYQQDWTCRISEECKAWAFKSVIFFTLTYDDSQLPLQVTFNHPVTLSSYCFGLRQGCLSSFYSHLISLGLTSFYYTRPLRQNTSSFLRDRKVLQDSYLDMDVYKRPALIVPTVRYEDVNSWIRYCRKWFDRNVRSVPFRDSRVSPYLEKLTWKNIHGVESKFPDSAYTPSFKYWITSEYGPGTLRPHYHGVLFGVSEDMFRDVFAPWWREHFGSGSDRSVKFSVYDAEKGGALYISKYCSKGSFDHPLVSKSIHYPSGKEYISKDYINCLNWFGFNFPLCLPPFRLISKGIGIRYVFDASVQSYWGVQCDEFTGFVTKDKDKKVVPLSFLSQVDQSVTNVLSYFKENDVDSVPSVFSREYVLKRFDCRKRLKLYSQSDFVVDPSLSSDSLLCFQNQIYNKEYVRSYFYKGSFKTYSCLLPRYYRRFLLSPFSQVAFSVVSRVRNVDDFNRKRKEIKSKRSQNEKDALLRQMWFGEKVGLRLSQKKIADRFGRFYSKVFLGDA